MKCEDCCHAEMCKWIDELEGRGCDFLSQGQISLDDINNAIEASFRNGVRSAKVEQEPCDDAISRDAVIKCLERGDTLSSIDHRLMDRIKRLPSVTQKSGKWIDYQKNGWIYAQCSECGEVHDSPSVYCPSCGAKMVEPQESEVKE